MKLIHTKINWALMGAQHQLCFKKINKFEWSVKFAIGGFLFYLVMHMTFYDHYYALTLFHGNAIACY